MREVPVKTKHGCMSFRRRKLSLADRDKQQSPCLYIQTTCLGMRISVFYHHKWWFTVFAFGCTVCVEKQSIFQNKGGKNKAFCYCPYETVSQDAIVAEALCDTGTKTVNCQWDESGKKNDNVYKRDVNLSLQSIIFNFLIIFKILCSNFF